MTLAARRCRGDDGFSALEGAVLFPIMMLFVMFAVFGARTFTARNEVVAAARAGARAASEAASPGEAASRAQTEAVGSVQSGGVSCLGGPAVNVDVSSWQPDGGWVTVTVRCHVRLVDLGLLRVGDRTVSATARESVDTHRDIGP
jgi:Flp pilus assembly protein TadG